MALVDHAEYELALLKEDPTTVDGLLKVVGAWAAMGHSGGSHYALLPVLIRLLEQRNLTPLTDNTEEWEFRNKDLWPPNGIWQNRRNPEAFSEDGGKTYWLLSDISEDAKLSANTTRYVSVKYVKESNGRE